MTRPGKRNRPKAEVVEDLVDLVRHGASPIAAIDDLGLSYLYAQRLLDERGDADDVRVALSEANSRMTAATGVSLIPHSSRSPKARERRLTLHQH